MQILAFETALGKCSVSLGVNGRQIGYMQAVQSFQQSEELFSIINRLLIENKCTFQALEAVAVNVGPGSFTGVRIGVAAARGLKLVLPKIKLIGITTLELVANAKNACNNLVSVMNAGQSEYYVQLFDSGLESKSEILCLSIEKIYQLLRLHQNYSIVSHCQLDGIKKYEQVTFDAGILLACAFKKINSISIDDTIAPLYMKFPHITSPKKVTNSVINKEFYSGHVD